MAYEKIEAPAGNYIGWGTKPKQHVTGKVIDYDQAGGTDFGNNPCPLLEVELSARAASFNKEGQRTDYEAGETVMLTCGLANLKRTIKKADLKPGDLVKITLSQLLKVPNGTLKEFDVQVDRQSASTPASSASSGSFDDAGDDDEPPF